ncbi:MAG: hypothetical protein ABJL56_19190, partial [Nitratireductor sp.]
AMPATDRTTVSDTPISHCSSATLMTGSRNAQRGSCAWQGRSPSAAPAGDEGVRFWSITAVGGNVWIKFGAAPVAASGQDWLVLDGQTREFAATAGDKVAVIDA